jgi:hypothetical protein
MKAAGMEARSEKRCTKNARAQRSLRLATVAMVAVLALGSGGLWAQEAGYDPHVPGAPSKPTDYSMSYFGWQAIGAPSGRIGVLRNGSGSSLVKQEQAAAGAAQQEKEAAAAQGQSEEQTSGDGSSQQAAPAKPAPRAIPLRLPQRVHADYQIDMHTTKDALFTQDPATLAWSNSDLKSTDQLLAAVWEQQSADGRQIVEAGYMLDYQTAASSDISVINHIFHGGAKKILREDEKQILSAGGGADILILDERYDQGDAFPARSGIVLSGNVSSEMDMGKFLLQAGAIERLVVLWAAHQEARLGLLARGTYPVIPKLDMTFETDLEYTHFFSNVKPDGSGNYNMKIFNVTDPFTLMLGLGGTYRVSDQFGLTLGLQKLFLAKDYSSTSIVVGGKFGL